jgi:hypothetical protein
MRPPSADRRLAAADSRLSQHPLRAAEALITIDRFEDGKVAESWTQWDPPRERVDEMR